MLFYKKPDIISSKNYSCFLIIDFDDDGGTLKYGFKHIKKFISFNIPLGCAKLGF
jgi:hypothetical protein